MSRTDFHVHTNYCHGQGRMESYVKKAVDKKMRAIAFTSHAPVPFETDWHIKAESLEAYLAEISFLKDKYSNEISIYKGLEVDYIQDITGPGHFKNKDLEIIIGSIHYVGSFDDGTPCCIDNTTEEFERGLREIFGGNIQKLVGAYYGELISMIRNDPPDIVGHLDIIKKLNAGNKYFSEEAPWYRKVISGVIEALSASNCVVEVNTRGYYKGIMKDFSAGKSILEKCFAAGIPVTVSSDAHRPDEIGRSFDEVDAVLRGTGYRSIHVFDGKAWQAVELMLAANE